MFKKEKIISFKKYKETHSIISWKLAHLSSLSATAAAPVAIPYLCRATQCCDAYRYELSLSLSLTVFQPHPFPLPVLLIFIVNVPFFRPLLPSRSLTVCHSALGA